MRRNKATPTSNLSSEIIGLEESDSDWETTKTTSHLVFDKEGLKVEKRPPPKQNDEKHGLSRLARLFLGTFGAIRNLSVDELCEYMSQLSLAAEQKSGFWGIFLVALGVFDQLGRSVGRPTLTQYIIGSLPRSCSFLPNTRFGVTEVILSQLLLCGGGVLLLRNSVWHSRLRSAMRRVWPAEFGGDRYYTLLDWTISFIGTVILAIGLGALANVAVSEAYPPPLSAYLVIGLAIPTWIFLRGYYSIATHDTAVMYATALAAGVSGTIAFVPLPDPNALSESQMAFRVFQLYCAPISVGGITLAAILESYSHRSTLEVLVNFGEHMVERAVVAFPSLADRMLPRVRAMFTGSLFVLLEWEPNSRRYNVIPPGRVIDLAKSRFRLWNLRKLQCVTVSYADHGGASSKLDYVIHWPTPDIFAETLEGGISSEVVTWFESSVLQEDRLKLLIERATREGAEEASKLLADSIQHINIIYSNYKADTQTISAGFLPNPFDSPLAYLSGRAAALLALTERKVKIVEDLASISTMVTFSELTQLWSRSFVRAINMTVLEYQQDASWQDNKISHFGLTRRQMNPASADETRWFIDIIVDRSRAYFETSARRQIADAKVPDLHAEIMSDYCSKVEALKEQIVNEQQRLTRLAEGTSDRDAKFVQEKQLKLLDIINGILANPRYRTKDELMMLLADNLGLTKPEQETRRRKQSSGTWPDSGAQTQRGRPIEGGFPD